MKVNILINEIQIEAFDFSEEVIQKQDSKRKLKKITFDFHVQSADYHDITTMLYTNDFAVKVPKRNLEFQAIIYNYSTSITNLYEENEVGVFHLELIEKG